MLTKIRRLRTSFSKDSSIVILTIFLVGLNLTPAITSVAFVITDIQNDYHLNSTTVGLLTSIPLGIFVLLSMLIPKFGNIIGLARSIMYSLLLISLSMLFRLIPNKYGLFLGTIGIGIGIAVGNVLIPTIIKGRFPAKAGILMGVFTASLCVGPTLTSFFTLPLVHATNSWRWALFFWVTSILISMPFWLLQLREPEIYPQVSKQHFSYRKLLDNPIAWSIALYFGLENALFYIISAWLPTILLDRGVPENNTSFLLATINILSIPFTFLASVLISRTRNQVWTINLSCILLGLGLAMLFFMPLSYDYLGSVLAGTGFGIQLGIAYSLPILRSGSPETTSILGAFSQTVGYILAALGPVTAGFIHDLTKHWSPLLVSLLILIVIQTFAGLIAGKGITIK